MIFPTGPTRDNYISWMREFGILTPFHYVPLHTSPYGIEVQPTEPETLPLCEKLGKTLVRLPLFYNLSLQEQDFVIDKTIEFLRTQ